MMIARLDRMGVLLFAAVAAGCGGSGGGGTGGSGATGSGSGGSGSGGSGSGGSGPVAFQCRGAVGDSSGDVLTLPAPNTPRLDICEPADVSFPNGVAACVSRCQAQLQSYADALNAMNDPAQPITVSQLNCNINDFQQEAPDCSNLPASETVSGSFVSGPSQYLATLSGNMHLDVGVDTPVGSLSVSRDSPAHGTVGYTILPLSRTCPSTGCQLLMTTFALGVDDFDIGLSVMGQTLFDHNVQGMTILNAGWISGLWHPNGRFEIPPGYGGVTMVANDNGVRTGVERFNDAAITGSLDPVSGVVSFDTFSQIESGGSTGTATVTIQGLAGNGISGPPQAVITLPGTIECNRQNGAAVTLDGSASSAPNNDLHFFSWRVNGGPVLSGKRAPAVLPLGSSSVVLNVFNSTLAVGTARAVTTVVDTTPPTIETRPPVTVETCANAPVSVALTPPTATDLCSATTTVTGKVISAAPPIPIVGGTVSLPPGTHTIQWTASDGQRTSTSTQIVTVQPGILASGQLLVRDRALVTVPSGGPADVGNAGSVATQIGNDAAIGGILSVAPVTLLDRVNVQGSIRTAGAYTPGHSDVISRTVTSFASVSLPPVPNLSGVVFPPPSGGNPTFNPTSPPGGTTPLAPGSYGTVTINSGARVALSPGSYFIQRLLINSASSTLVIPTTGVVRLYVAVQLAYRGQVVNASGQLAQIVLGYNGTDAAVLEAPFYGTLIAPRGMMSFGTSTGQVFRGRFFGTALELRSGMRLTCDTGVSAQ